MVDVRHLGLPPDDALPERHRDHPGEVVAGQGVAAGQGVLDPVTLGRAVPLREALDAYQRWLIERGVAANDGNWAAAALDLGLHRSNLHHLAQRLGLKN